MSENEHQIADDVSDADTFEESRDDGVETHHDVEIARNAVLTGAVGVVAGVLALAYLVRAVGSGGPGSWLFTLVLAAIAAWQLASFLDARVPLLVADSFGVRIRLGQEWRGLPWSSLEQVVVEPRTSLLHDGRLVVVPRFLERALDGLDAQGRRQVAVSQKVYGAPLVVPLGMTTKVSVPHLVDALANLAGMRTAVVELAGHAAEPVQPIDEEHRERLEATQREYVREHEHEQGRSPDLVGAGAGAGAGAGHMVSSDHEHGQRTFVGLSIFDKLGFDQMGAGAAMLISRAARGRSHDVDAPAPETPVMPAPVVAAEPVPADPVTPSWTPALPLRSAKPALRVDVRLESQQPTLRGGWDTPPPILGSAAPQLDLGDSEAKVGPKLPEDAVLRPGGDWEDEPESDTAFDVVPTVAPVVVDDLAPHAAAEPVIGPRIAAARSQVGLDVDALSDRTRIRPHVIEAIEVDDFGPCGGDFYARGHLRSLCRVLGLPTEEVLAEFDEHYASAPIEASRVFEAELASGLRGSMRATFGGPRWGLMLGVVLVLVLAWGIARLFVPDTQADPAPPSLGSSAATNQKPITSVFGAPLRISVRAIRGPSDVVVRDHTGRVLWSGQLAQGTHRQIVGVAPFTVRASDPSVVDVWLAGKPKGAVGAGTEPAARRFER